MKRKHGVSRLILVCVFSISVLGIPLPPRHPEALRLLNSAVPVAYHFEKPASDHDLPNVRDLASKCLRTSKPGILDRSRERSLDHGLHPILLHQTPVNPGFASRLDFCSEFTKPDSLVIRSMGTPKNHRSPPA